MSTPASAANMAAFRFRISADDSADLRVTALDGVEALSELFHYRVRLISADRRIAIDPLLGRPAVIEIDGARGTREIHGIVRRFHRTGQSGDLGHYQAEVVPPHWVLTRRIQSRVFNVKRCPRMDVVGIVSKVLVDAGLPDKAISTAGLRSIDSREFVVQYGESDWAFICRLLEQEGIYFYFDRGPDGCRMVLKDAAAAHAPFDGGEGVVPFRDARNLVANEEHVFDARRSGRIRSGAAAIDDFDFRNPGRELRIDQTGSVFTALARFHFPGGYAEAERGKRLLQTRFEAEQCGTPLFSFKSTVRDLWPGGRMTLKDHPDESFDGEYLLTRVRIIAEQPQSGESDVAGGAGSRFKATARAIPAPVQFRAPLKTPWPRVRGSQTALVVGPPNEEIHVDEYGRVEVRFHWDQEWGHEVGASCWIRVSQGWAGGQYGMLFLPRVGQEVIVDFLEGDPDQPIITGRVYNKDHLPPYKLPDHRTVSTIRSCTSPGAAGGNELRFEDKKGGEQLLLFAQNAMHQRSRGPRFESVGGDAHRRVEGASFELMKKARHSIVKLDSLERVEGTQYTEVRGGALVGINKRYDLWIGGPYRVVTQDEVIIDADKAITLYCMGNFIRLDPGGLTISAKQVRINSGGAGYGAGALPDGKVAEEALAAATTEFGHNTRYDQAPRSSRPAEDAGDRKTSWIEIELIDDLGMPVPNEPFEILLPDGQKISGSLNAHGQAHVPAADPGQCRITFPRLDAQAWEPVA